MKRLAWACRIAVPLAVFACLITTPAEGQQRPARRAQLEQRLRDRFAELAQTRLQIDDERTAQLRRVLESFGQDRLVLAAETRALKVKVRGAVRASGDDPVDDEEGAAYLTTMRELAQRETALVIAEQDALGQVLTPGQLVVFYMLRDQMTDRLRQLRAREGNDPGRH